MKVVPSITTLDVYPHIRTWYFKMYGTYLHIFEHDMSHSQKSAVFSESLQSHENKVQSVDSSKILQKSFKWRVSNVENCLMCSSLGT